MVLLPGTGEGEGSAKRILLSSGVITQMLAYEGYLVGVLSQMAKYR
jgi:hypothetical protein